MPAELTQEQRAAAESPYDMTAILACAGSGKTRTLVARVCFLLQRDARPEDILVLCFSRSACAVFRERLVSALGDVGKRVVVTTFHALAAAFVVPPGMRVATEIESDEALRSVASGPTRRAANKLSGIRALRGAVVDFEAYGLLTPDVHLVERRMRNVGLVPMWSLLPRVREISRCLAFAHVIVDEAQDCTSNEMRYAMEIAVESLTIAGDPRQAIFGWRGAIDPVSLLAGHQALVYVYSLTRSFRFGAAIAGAANAFMAAGESAIQPAPDVASTVTASPTIREAVAQRVGSTMLLCRTNHECEMAAMESADIVLVRRDPLDSFADDAERLQAVWDDGKVPTLMIHASKGREADTVILVRDLEAKHVDEEMRVTHVGITRARSNLVICGLNGEINNSADRSRGSEGSIGSAASGCRAEGESDNV